jgi:succinate dehydrogenase cytochrome b556 subunit/succinate dehydrogenase hydrophobic membrane anchor protein
MNARSEMQTSLTSVKITDRIFGILNKIPFVAFYAKTRGWEFILSWSHRITGLLLLVYLWFHLITLSALSIPGEYDAKMALFSSPLIVFFEWLLAIPVIFHAVNGGRLMLFEFYGYRDDSAMIRWSFAVSAAYLCLLAVFMLLGNQSVSPIFFWLTVFMIAVICGYAFSARIWRLGHSPFWKFQRVSAVFLLVMIPAHFLFMHLNPAAGKDSAVIILRMQNFFVKIVDLAMVLAVVYHAGYGLFSVGKDYIVSRRLQILMTVLVASVVVSSAWIGLKIIIRV